MVAVDEDFFVIVRVAGSHSRVLLSDVTAADEWELAASAVEFLGLPIPMRTTTGPAGDLDLLGDLGMHAMDMGVLLDDVDLYPDEMLSDVARRSASGRCSTRPWASPRLDVPTIRTPRCARRWTRRASRWPPVTYRSAPSCCPGASSSAGGATCASRGPTRPATPRSSRCARPPPPGASGGSTGGPSTSPSSPARCAPARPSSPGRARGVRRLGRQGRRGRQPLGRGARPAAQPPPRGRRRRARRGVGALLEEFFPEQR